MGSQYGAMAEAFEILIAQLYLQGKLTTPSHQNLNIRHKNVILKANELAPYV
jgi:hypothetical protein